jgi:iron complex outermembrane receptor protein
LVNDGEHSQYTQEFKATGNLMSGKLDYVAGLYWFHDENTTSFANITLPLTGSPTVTQDRTMSNDTDAYAVYAQFDYHLTDKLRATAGVRYTDEMKEIAFKSNPNPLPRSAALNQPFSTADLVRAGVPTNLNKNLWTPRFNLDYQFDPNLMVFASATNGFKSGGWNARANYAALAIPFEPEQIWSYESGVRSDWFDKRLRVNLTGFYFDDKKFQLPAGYVDPVTNSVIYLTRNFADLENYGVELETSAVVTEHLNVFASAGWQHARYTNIDPSVLAQAARCRAGTAIATNCNNGIVTPTGQIAKPVRAPTFSSTLGAAYDFAVTSEWNLVPNASWSHTSAHFVGTANTPISYSKTRDNLNGGISLQNSNIGWTFSFDCTNCTDQAYVVSYLVFPYLNEPRRWMFHARKDF